MRHFGLIKLQTGSATARHLQTTIPQCLFTCHRQRSEPYHWLPVALLNKLDDPTRRVSCSRQNQVGFIRFPTVVLSATHMPSVRPTGP